MGATAARSMTGAPGASNPSDRSLFAAQIATARASAASSGRGTSGRPRTTPPARLPAREALLRFEKKKHPPPGDELRLVTRDQPREEGVDREKPVRQAQL